MIFFNLSFWPINCHCTKLETFTYNLAKSVSKFVGRSLCACCTSLLWNSLWLISLATSSDCLAGLVVKASALRAEDPRFKSCLRQDFSGSSHTSDLKIGTTLVTLPGDWHYRFSAGTGRPGVSILWLGEVESLIYNICLSVAAHKIVWTDPSLRYTSTGMLSNQPTNKDNLGGLGVGYGPWECDAQGFVPPSPSHVVLETLKLVLQQPPYQAPCVTESVLRLVSPQLVVCDRMRWKVDLQFLFPCGSTQTCLGRSVC